MSKCIMVKPKKFFIVVLEKVVIAGEAKTCYKNKMMQWRQETGKIRTLEGKAGANS